VFISLPVYVNVLLLAIVPVLGVYNYWKAHRLVVHEKTLELPKLSREINIAQLSDVHFGSVRHRKIIEDISAKLNTLDCELAIISGDLADGSSVVEEDDFMAFSDVKMPIIFTPGNHDFYPGIKSVINACRKAGVIVLDNESMEFECLNIYGLTFSFGDRPTPKPDELAVSRDKVNIINYHVPYLWEEFSDVGFDIQLSGHTHGGQFSLFGLTPAMFKYRHYQGLYQTGQRRLYVTKGLGGVVPYRFGVTPEIVVITLRSEQ
jgi:predicted MPP superfamily phosphohydrolase